MWNSAVHEEGLLDLYTKDISNNKKKDCNFEKFNSYKFDKTRLLKNDSLKALVLFI